MPCLLGLGALFFPRVILVLVWLFSDYLNVYSSIIWFILGLIFLPLTTLAYAFALHFGGGSVTLGGIVVIVIAVLIDLGMLAGGGHSARTSKST